MNYMETYERLKEVLYYLQYATIREDIEIAKLDGISITPQVEEILLTILERRKEMDFQTRVEAQKDRESEILDMSDIGEWYKQAKLDEE